MAIGLDPPLLPVPCVRPVPFPLVKVVCPVQPASTPSLVYLCVARAPLEPRLLVELHLVIYAFLKMIVHMVSFKFTFRIWCFYVYIVYN